MLALTNLAPGTAAELNKHCFCLTTSKADCGLVAPFAFLWETLFSEQNRPRITAMDAPKALEIRLDTWKSIAQYLGRSSRTVQRWHAGYGLPVRHLGSGSSSVFAYPNELDEWLKGRASNVSSIDFVPEMRSTSEQSPSEPIAFPLALVSTAPRPSRSTDLFARAERMWASLSESNLSAIAHIYRQLTDLEPWNARAFSGLAMTLIAGGVLCRLHMTEAFVSARAALKRAQQLDRNLPETRIACAWMKLLLERDWNGAETLFNELVLEAPASTKPVAGLALFRIAQGRFADVAQLLRDACHRSPLNAGLASLFCWAEYLAGHFEQALLLVALERDLGHSGAVLDAVEALATVMISGPEAAIDRLELLAYSAPRHFAALGVLGYAYAMAGNTRRGEEVLNRMTETGLRGHHQYSYSIALTYLGLGEPVKSVHWLGASYRQGSLWSLGFRWDPILAPLRSDPSCVPGLDLLSYPT